MKIIRYFVILLLLSSPTFAADHFIWDDATGLADGSSWTNAWTDLPSTFVRGDTYYVAGGSYGSHTFDTAVDGEDYIYIKKASAISACTESTGWQAAFATDQAVFTSTGTVWNFETSYWDVDGVVGERNGSDSGGSYAAHGFEVYNNSTTASGHTIVLDSGEDYIRLRHIEARNYQEDYDNSQDLLYQNTTSGSSIGHIFEYVYLHTTPRNGVTVNRVGDGSTPVILQNFWISGVYNGYGIHGQGVQIYPGPSNGFIIRNGVFKDVNGTAVISLLGSSGELNQNWFIYGNVFYTVGSSDKSKYSPSHGPGFGRDENYKEKIYFFNNTVYNLAQSAFNYDSDYTTWCPDLTSLVTANNLYISTTFSATTDGTIYSNSYYDIDGENVPSGETNQENLSSSPLNSPTTGDFTLVSATADGADLTQESWWNSTFCSLVDPAGNTRDADGTWDRGAYEYDEGGATEPATISYGTLQRGIFVGGD